MLFSPFTAIQSLCFKLCPKYRFFRGKIPPQFLSPYQQFFFITYCISHNVSVFASIFCVCCYTLPSVASRHLPSRSGGACLLLHFIPALPP